MPHPGLSSSLIIRTVSPSLCLEIVITCSTLRQKMSALCSHLLNVAHHVRVHGGGSRICRSIMFSDKQRNNTSLNEVMTIREETSFKLKLITLAQR